MAANTKRVAHVLGPSRGGIRRHVRYLATHPPAGYETAGVFGPDDLAEYFRDVAFAPVGSMWRFRTPAGVDVVHAHGFEAGVIILRRHTAPIVLSAHTDIDSQGRTSRSRIVHAAARFLASRADAVIASSPLVGRRFPKAHVILPATERLGSPKRSRAEVRAELGTRDDRVVVCTVARLHRDKGLDQFVRAVDAAGAEGWICGDGPLYDTLQGLVAGTSVRLLGYRDDVADILGAADVFALPSVGEAYGIAVAEAIGAGLPVIASTAGAMPDIVRDAGVLVAPGDEDAFAQAVRNLVRDTGKRASLAERAKRLTLPDPDDLVRQIGAVYDEITR